MDLVAALKTLVADQFTLYLKAHGYHWNVEGPMFRQFHDFFSDLYEDVHGSIDPAAENIRKLGGYPPFMLDTLASLTTVSEKKISTDPIAMCVDLVDANAAVLRSIAAAAEAADEAEEEGILNYLAERDDAHKKWAWQLKATIKK